MKRLKGEVERMKKVMKRVIMACLAFAMILALGTPASVGAATVTGICGGSHKE